MGVNNEKKSAIIIVILLIVTIGVLKLYPNLYNVTHNKFYAISSNDYEKELMININTQEIELKDKEIEINKLIHEAYDTEIILKGIKVVNESVWVDIICDTKWRLLGGTAITWDKVSDETGIRLYSSKMPMYETLDGEGNKIENNGAGYSDNIFSIELDKEVFMNTREIILKIKGLYVMEYDLKL